ncbi:MAG: IPTL-CTERM sorting domain-containing protein [Deltaproteobacteria bacterium]|nr:IPTL-CTERM sorting domain-containing protein [Deltaproteobacteria bacterium]
MRKRWKLFVVAVLVLLATSPAGAAITTYYGLDAGAGPASPLPSSNAQAAAFDFAAGALGSPNLITFEPLPVSVPAYSSSLSLGGGVTALLTGAFTHGTTGITSAPGDYNYGFNVTAGGSKYLELDINNAASPASVTYSFPSPVQAFGAYIGGVGTGGVAGSSLVARFNDGSSQQYTLVGAPDANGGMMFFGFTDPGAQITSVTIEEAGSFGIIDDSFSVDDIRYVTAGDAAGPDAATIPTLSSWGLAVMTAALAVVATMVLRRAGI